MELYLGTAPMQRCMRRKRCNDGMWVKTPRWRTCGICTFVVRTKHEGMQGNDLRVERMVDYWHLAFVFDGISMYLLVMQYRMGFTVESAGKWKLSAVLRLGDIYESLGHGGSIVPLLKRPEVLSEAPKHHVIANDESVDLLKLLRLGAMDHAACHWVQYDLFPLVIYSPPKYSLISC